MKKHKNVLKIALICGFASALVWGADVKLRIYLQDGTLQSGNLVTETNDSFVVLTRDGRAEVPKNKIMFINGKTLKQWQERPDKLFQTEILPSEIPDPSYVNDKTSLPPPVVAPSKPVSVVKPASQSLPEDVATQSDPAPVASKPPAVSGVTTKAAIPAITPGVPAARPPFSASQAVSKRNSPVSAKEIPVEPAKAKDSASSAATTPASAANPTVAPAPAPAEKRRRRRVATPSAVENKPEAAPTPSTAEPRAEKSASLPKPASVPLENLPLRFNRNEYSSYYYRQALQQLEQKERGKALNSLHLAAVLNRQDPEPTFMLGKTYLEAGLLGRANRFLSHPILKKREDAKALLAEVIAQQKAKKLHRRILYGGTGVAALTWIPLLILARRLRRAPRRVITAESVVASPFPDKNNIEKALEELIESTPAPVATDNGFVKIPTEPAKQMAAPAMMAPLPLAPQAPAEPAFVSPPMSTPVPVARPPMMPIPAPLSMPPGMPAPIIPLPAALKPIEIATAPPTPPLIPTGTTPIVPMPTEMPASIRFAPPAASSIPDTEAVLRLAAMVEQAVRKGNAWAVEEKFDQARRDYRTALALNPTCLEAHLGMAYICFSQTQMDLALEHYVRALKIDPASADAHYGIGQVLLETGRVDEAVAEFQQTLVLDPSFDDARETLTSLGAAA